MAEVKNENAKNARIQRSRAIGLTVGLACSIPISAAPAMAGQGLNQDALLRLHGGGRLHTQPVSIDRVRHQGKQNRNEVNVQNLVNSANFNLASARAEFLAGTLGSFQSLTIDVGGKQKVVTLDSKLTAGELIAADQVLNGGNQSIELRGNGVANGGTFQLNTNVLTALNKSVGGSINNLTISKGVGVVNTLDSLNLSGNFVNHGNFMAASHASGATDSIVADNIRNAKHGTMGSYAGSDLFGADLSLTGLTSISNAGRLSSAGTLTLNAPTIYNVGEGGSTASISAGNNINVSNASGLNVLSDGNWQANNINFNTSGGDLAITGGNFNSNDLNLNAKGTVEAALGSASGRVNASACVVHVGNTSGDLILGDINASGDPLFKSALSIVIDGTITPTNGAPLTIIAGKDVTATAAGQLNTSSAVGAGGNLTVIAGAVTKTDKKTGNIVVQKKSSFGGSIDLANLLGVDTTGAKGFTDGNAQFVAYGGSAKNVNAGKVLFSKASAVNLDTGSLLVIAGLKTGNSVDFNTVIAGDTTILSGTPTGKVAFDATTGAQVSGAFSSTGGNSGIITFNNAQQLNGNLNITTKGALNFNANTVGTNPEAIWNITSGPVTFDVGSNVVQAQDATDTATAKFKVTGDVNVLGKTSMGIVNMDISGALNVKASGVMNDAAENITTKGSITIDGEFGRNPATFDPTRPITTFNVNDGGDFIVSATGVVSGDGLITAKTFNNKGLMIGNTTYKTGKAAKGVAAFQNFGVVDGQIVTVDVGSGTILNAAGAKLQATQQTVPADVPTLNLTAAVVDNQGHIEAVGELKRTDGTLNISSPTSLTITGVDGGFFVDFASAVNLSAVKGDVTVGGVVANVNVDPFSEFQNIGKLGAFTVKALTGSFQSVMPGVDVTSDGEGNNGNISFEVQSIDYIGTGTAPNFFMNAKGDAKSIGKQPLLLNITGKQGITFGPGPGEFNALIQGFDVTSKVTAITQNAMNVNMANLVINKTGLELTGTKSLLITGKIVGGDNVTITTGNTKDFLVGKATVSGITGITPGVDGIEAGKLLTINTPKRIIINDGVLKVGDKSSDQIVLNVPSLLVNNDLGDIEGHKFSINPGTDPNASYTNLHAGGAIKSGGVFISATGTIDLSSGGGSKVDTFLSVGLNKDGAGGLSGGGTFSFNATDLKYSAKGLFLNAPGDAANPNGGEVLITLTGNKTLNVGLQSGAIRANVNDFSGYSDPEGSGHFHIHTAGNIVAKDILNGAVNFGFLGGSLILESTTSTVTVRDVDGILLNLFQISTNTDTPLLMSDASKNGVLDKSVLLRGGNIVFTNTGQVVTNGVNLDPTRLEITSDVSIDYTKNKQINIDAPGLPPNPGGSVFLTAPTHILNKQDGLLIQVDPGTDDGGSINIISTATDATGKIVIDAPGVGGAFHLDVGSFVPPGGKGGHIDVQAGNQLLVSGLGMNFGFDNTIEGASLNLQSGQATDTFSGSPLTFNDANSASLAGLSLGTVTLNSGSSSPFLLAGASLNNGNGLSNGALTAGTVIISPLNGSGVINTKGYAMITNNLQLNATTINFDANQTIAVVADEAVGTGGDTGNGGTIVMTADNYNFDKNGGVLLVAQGNGAKAGSIGGSITINDNLDKTLTIGKGGFFFDVSDSGVLPGQKGGSVNVQQSAGDLIVDNNAFTYGANDGGTLTLHAKGSMLVSNVNGLNPFFLDSITLQTDGAIGKGTVPFEFGSAVTNGFVDINPTLTAKAITINTAGIGAGIDTTTGKVSANSITLITTGNIDFASGSTLSALSDATTGSGGTINITAQTITQVGGAAGFTLQATPTTPGAAGGTVNVNITGGNPVVIGAGNLLIDVSTTGAGSGGSVTVNAAGNLTADISKISFGPATWASGPSLTLNSGSILAVNNVASISGSGKFGTLNLGSRSSQDFVLGGAKAGTNGIQDSALTIDVGSISISNSGILTTATVGGQIKAGGTDIITVVDPTLPGGQISVSYTFVDGDTRDIVATNLAKAINTDPNLQLLGVNATATGSVITLSSPSVGTTFTDVAAKGSKLDLLTLAEGGNIANGDLVSLTGASSTSATLNASGDVGHFPDILNPFYQPIEFNGSAAVSITVNAGKNATIRSQGGAAGVALNAVGHADAGFLSGDVNAISGTSGSISFNYLNANAANTNKITLTQLTTTNGDLTVFSNSGQLIVGTSAQINSNNGNITLVNTRGGGQINILDDAKIHGSGAVTAPNQGNVYIFANFGGVPATFLPGTQPAGTTVVETGGANVTFSFPAGAPTITADPTATFQALGRDLAIGQTNPGQITVGKNVVITADPPPIGSMSALLASSQPTQAYNQSSSALGGRSAPASLAGAMPVSSLVSNTGFSTSAVTSSTPVQTATSNVMPSTSNNFEPGAGNSMMIQTAPVLTPTIDAATSGSQTVVGPVGTINLDNAYLSALSSIRNVTMNSVTANNSVDLLSTTLTDGETATVNLSNNERTAGTTLSGTVSSDDNHRTLDNGPLLIAPEHDLVIDTPQGSVSIAAKSLVLIVTSEKGLSVYNLHDTHKNSVVISHQDKSISVAPGSSAVIVDPSVKAFEQVNAAQFVGYRQMKRINLTKSSHLFKSEFEVMSMMRGLPALRDLMNSDNQKVRETMKGMLKTTAILMQLSQGGESYKLYIAPEVTAYTK